MKKKNRKKWTIFALCLVLLGVYTFIEPFLLQTVRLEIKHVDIPEEFEGFTMVFLTDIHHGPYFSQKRVARLVDRVNKLAPDAVLIGGDNVHREDTRHIVSFYSEIEGLEAEYGVYGVMGNHDYWMSEELSVLYMARSNIRLLRNSGSWIEKGNSRIFLGGVDDMTEGCPDVQTTMQNADDSDFTVLLSHNPEVAETQSLQYVDWIFSGHTHGGQVTFFGLFAPILPTAYGQKYRSGLVKKGETSVFVSNGVGTITPPIRFFARPQIIYITLHAEK